jgi:hypothetical protein
VNGFRIWWTRAFDANDLAQLGMVIGFERQ